jgi:predicted TIM-barrel fold metal-dependent hydrolase
MEQTKRLIDIHCHTAGIGAGGSGCFVSPALRGSFRYRFFLKAFGVTEQGLRDEGDALILRRLSETLQQSRRVSAAVIMAMDAVVRSDGEPDEAATEIHIPDEFVAAEVRRYPNLLFGASVNPYRRDAIKRLDRAADNNAVLLKWLPSIQHIDPADPRLIPFYKRLRDLGLPLLSHTGSERTFTRARDDFADPDRLRLPLSLGVKVIAAHAGGSGRSRGEGNYRRFLRLCREFPNLYADISALTQINRPGQLTRLLRHRELHGRLVYGTDMPLVNTCITTPLAFPLRLSPWRMFAVSRIVNPWDRDVALKEMLGWREKMLLDVGKILRGTRGASPFL